MQYSEELITPQIAKQYLQWNTNNTRKLNHAKVNMYAADMTNGRWQYNGETVQFAVSGVLKNGQHRLAAIIKSGVPQRMLVVRGVPDDVNVFDVGFVRSGQQIARQSGISKGASQQCTLGAASLLLSKTFSRTDASKIELIELIEKNESLWELAYYLTCKGSKRPICRKSSIILGAYCLLRTAADQEELEEFFRVANTGFPTEGRDCSPAIVLRNMTISGKDGLLDGKNKRRLIYATISGFSDFTNGVRRVMAYKDDDKRAERCLRAVRYADGVISYDLA